MPFHLPEDYSRLIAMLETLVENRTLLAEMSKEERVALLLAAGRLSRPTRHEQQRASKAFRVITRKQHQAHDRDVRAATEIRTARRAEVFTAPPELVADTGAENTVGELSQSRNC